MTYSNLHFEMTLVTCILFYFYLVFFFLENVTLSPHEAFSQTIRPVVKTGFWFDVGADYLLHRGGGLTWILHTFDTLISIYNFGHSCKLQFEYMFEVKCVI